MFKDVDEENFITMVSGLKKRKIYSTNWLQSVSKDIQLGIELIFEELQLFIS